MNDGVERKLLLALRGAGPCSVKTLATLLTLTWEQAYRGVYRLRAKNLVCRTGPARYDITRRGRRVFEEITVPDEPLLDAVKR